MAETSRLTRWFFLFLKCGEPNRVWHAVTASAPIVLSELSSDPMADRGNPGCLLRTSSSEVRSRAA